MTEIKINIELGVTAELKEFVTNLFSGAIHTAVMPSPKLNTATAEHMTLPRRRAASSTTAGTMTTTRVEEPQAPAQTEPAEAEAPKSAITLPNLREAVKRLYDGGKHQEELPTIFGKFGVKNVIEVSEDRYQELYDVLTAKAEELGL